MSKIKYLLGLICLLWGAIALAATVTCTGNPVPTKSQVLPYSPSADAVTPPGVPSQYKQLYTWDYFSWGAATSATAYCSPASTQVSFIEYVIPPAGSVPVFDSASQSWIFPIPGSGYGLSFWNLDQKKGSIGTVDHPSNRWSGIINSYGNFVVDVTLWKMPGVQNNSYNVNISGFQVIQAVQLINASDTFDTNLPDNGPNLLARSFTTNTVDVSGNITFSTGTCSFTDKTVQMGTYDTIEQGAAASPWQDASFTLQCPQAMGYYRVGILNTSNIVTSRTAVTTKNQNVNITVVPRSEIVDNVRGVMALSSGGAEGYGVQLAWGTVASQSTAPTPAQPVIFNVPIQQATAAFAVGSTNNLTVNMAARYIRTTGDVNPGPANAVVEIIANYN